MHIGQWAKRRCSMGSVIEPSIDLEQLRGKSGEELELQVLQILLDVLQGPMSEALERAAISHWFDEPILNVLLDETVGISVEDALKHLAAFSFTRGRDGGGFLLHEKVREQLLKKWQDTRQVELAKLSGKLAVLFEILERQDKMKFEYLAEAV